MHRCSQVDPRNRCSPIVTEGDLSLAWVRWRFPGLSPVSAPSHSASRHPTPRLGRDSLSFLDSRQEILAASSGMLATPGLFWPDQSLPAASTPAPGPHTSTWKDRSLDGSQLRQPYPDCSGAFSVAGRPALGTGTGPGLTTGLFQPHGILDLRMSLSTLSFSCRRRATAILRYGRNPCVIQADTEPPGRLPPAPGSHVRRSAPSPGDLSLAQVW
jgi:hypothetical protein